MTDDWRSRAACKGMSPSLFVEPGEGSVYAAEARAACAACPVADDCLWDALLTGETRGLRGGLGPRDRARLAKGRERTRLCVVCNHRFVLSTSAPHRESCSTACRQRRKASTRYSVAS